MKIEDIKNDLKEAAPEFAKRIAPVYKLLNWKWGGKIPNEEEILRSTLRLIDKLEIGVTVVSSGGIEIFNAEVDGHYEYGLQMAIKTTISYY